MRVALTAIAPARMHPCGPAAASMRALSASRRAVVGGHAGLWACAHFIN